MICKDVFLLLGFNLSTTSIGVVATVIILYLYLAQSLMLQLDVLY